MKDNQIPSSVHIEDQVSQILNAYNQIMSGRKAGSGNLAQTHRALNSNYQGFLSGSKEVVDNVDISGFQSMSKALLQNVQEFLSDDASSRIRQNHCRNQGSNSLTTDRLRQENQRRRLMHKKLQ